MHDFTGAGIHEGIFNFIIRGIIDGHPVLVLSPIRVIRRVRGKGPVIKKGRLIRNEASLREKKILDGLRDRREWELENGHSGFRRSPCGRQNLATQHDYWTLVRYRRVQNVFERNIGVYLGLQVLRYRLKGGAGATCLDAQAHYEDHVVKGWESLHAQWSVVVMEDMTYFNIAILLQLVKVQGKEYNLESRVKMALTRKKDLAWDKEMT